MSNTSFNNADIIQQLTAADVPLLFWGAPGVGKTACITDVARDNDVHLEVLIGSTIDPTDLGRPVVQENGDVKLAPPTWARRIRGALAANKKTWLFLDELTCAPPSVQAALLRVVQERQVADCSIAGCRILAAANPVEHAVDSVDLSHASANRWAHVDWMLDVDEWVGGELGGWGKPSTRLSEIRGLVTTWVKQKPDTLLAPPPAHVESIKGWPSPRAWSNAIAAIGNIETLHSKLGQTIATSLLGAVAHELIAWSRDVTLPSAEDLLNGTEPLPARGDRAMLATSIVTSYVVNKPERLPDFWKLCNQQRSDLCILTAKRAMKALDAAGIDPKMTPAMSSIIDKIRSLENM